MGSFSQFFWSFQNIWTLLLATGSLHLAVDVQKKQAFLFSNLAQHHLHFIFGLYFFQHELVYILWILLFFKYFKQGYGYWSNWGNRNQILQAVQVVGISYFMCACNSLCNGAKSSWNGILYQSDFKIFLQILSLFPTCW